MNEYEVFRLLWWVLLGVLLIGLAVMTGSTSAPLS
jgi:cytochrome bd-type quinol oxidase subunit 2